MAKNKNTDAPASGFGMRKVSSREEMADAFRGSQMAPRFVTLAPTPRERMMVRMHGRQLAHAVAARGITSAIVHVSCGDDWIRSLASRLGITVTARVACYEITRPDDLSPSLT